MRVMKGQSRAFDYGSQAAEGIIWSIKKCDKKNHGVPVWPHLLQPPPLQYGQVASTLILFEVVRRM